jgi:F-type H+-transporting ATPase subunit delta
MASGAATRYARALYETAREQDCLDAVGDDIEAVGNLLAASDDFAHFIAYPGVEPARQVAVLNHLFGEQAAPLTNRFLAFLVEKSRLDVLTDICAAFGKLYDDAKGVLRVQVISARPLADDQAAALADRLGQRFARTILPTHSVDPALIAGFVIVAGDQVLDFSVRSQLDDLKKKIIEA